MNKKGNKDIPFDLIQQALVQFALKPLALADLPPACVHHQQIYSLQIHLNFPSLTFW
jgi:hypothetical protein